MSHLEPCANQYPALSRVLVPLQSRWFLRNTIASHALRLPCIGLCPLFVSIIATRSTGLYHVGSTSCLYLCVIFCPGQLHMGCLQACFEVEEISRQLSRTPEPPAHTPETRFSLSSILFSTRDATDLLDLPGSPFDDPMIFIFRSPDRQQGQRSSDRVSRRGKEGAVFV